MLNEKFDYLQRDPFAMMADVVDAPTAETYDFLLNSGNAAMMPTVSGNLYIPDSIDYPIDALPLEAKQPQNVLTDNGGILSLPLTDKTSLGIFEALPYVRSDSVLADRNWKERDANQTDPNISYNAPEAAALDTYLMSASPLQTSYTGDSAYLSGTDPLPVSAQDMQQPAQEMPYDAQRPSDCGTFDFACKWKSVNQEVYLFIIGAIILAIGIYALTR